MLNKILSLGDRIELTKILSEEKKKQLEQDKSIKTRVFVSQIYDILDNDLLKIAMPIVEGRVIPLPLNARFEACFFTSAGLYKCRIVITDRYKEDGLYILVVEFTTELKKYQRRQYYRLDCGMDIEYTSIKEDGLINFAQDNTCLPQIINKDELNSGFVLDISGGGMRFTSKEKLEKDETIAVLLNIVSDTGICIRGICAKVLSSIRLINKDGIYEQRIEFINLSKVTRENIIRYIFEQERKLRKKQ